jgi:hypothetical protein
MQSIPQHPTPLRCSLIISTHLRLGPPSGLFPSCFHSNNLHTVLFSPFVLHALPISSSSFLPVFTPTTYMQSPFLHSCTCSADLILLLFPSCFHTNNLITVLFSPIRATCSAHLILLLFPSCFHTNLHAVLFSPFVLHALPISTSSTRSL